MKSRFITAVSFLVLLVFLNGNAQAATTSSHGQPALVYVSLATPEDLNRFASTQLPMYIMLDGGLLVGSDQAGQQVLLDAGLTFRVLDPDLYSGSYYLTGTRPGRPALDFSTFGKILLKTGDGVLLRMDSSQVDALSKAGAELQLITLTPKPLPLSQNQEVFPEVVNPDPIIQEMIDQVTETQVITYDRQLAGELPVWVDGDWYTISTRNTYSGTPIQKTTHFVGQHMQDLGMDVEYHQWDGVTDPNVIGEISGLTNPEDIFIIGAHIDDVNGTPGADDNASGSVATLLAADILSKYWWGCTLRFAFWTGEEYGLLGSHAYARRAYQAGENILGYLNLDMIAWNTSSSPPGIDVIYNAVMPSTHILAQLFADVVDAYNINLIPELRTSLSGGSDHSSFWGYGYTAILSIEDQGDFNPNYHGPGDNPAHTDPAYFTDFVKASIGTYAHMTGCLIPGGVGHLNGHVTHASTGDPIGGVLVTASKDTVGIGINAITDSAGYYTMTLPADTYTVTASLIGYATQVQSASIATNQVTTLDFALQPVCEPLSDLNFTWLPLQPTNGDLITFTAATQGTPPVDFQWSFGDTYTSTGATVTHAYFDEGTYPVDLSASNACSSQEVSKDISIWQKLLKIFLPMIKT